MRFVNRSLPQRIGIAAASIAFCATITVSSPIHAQPASPEAVPPEECTTEPLPATFLRDIIATPVSATPVAPLTTLPQGTEPDDQTRAEITAVIRQLTACSNTGEVLRALALFGDEYLRRTINPLGMMTPEEALGLIAPFATPLALSPDQYVRLVEISDMRVLPDGRVAAVTVTIPIGGGRDVDLLIFSRTEDGWIIEDAISNWDLIEQPATPAA